MSVSVCLIVCVWECANATSAGERPPLQVTFLPGKCHQSFSFHMFPHVRVCVHAYEHACVHAISVCLIRLWQASIDFMGFSHEDSVALVPCPVLLFFQDRLETGEQLALFFVKANKGKYNQLSRPTMSFKVRIFFLSEEGVKHTCSSRDSSGLEGDSNRQVITREDRYYQLDLKIDFEKYQ